MIVCVPIMVCRAGADLDHNGVHVHKWQKLCWSNIKFEVKHRCTLLVPGINASCTSPGRLRRWPIMSIVSRVLEEVRMIGGAPRGALA